MKAISIRRDGLALEGITPDEFVLARPKTLHLTEIQHLAKERPIDIAFIEMKAISIGRSLARCWISVRCKVFGRARTNSSGVIPSSARPSRRIDIAFISMKSYDTEWATMMIR